MRVLLTGAGGQLGSALADTAPADVELDARPRSRLDIADEAQVNAAIEDAQPEVVINAAAYTMVDQAESEPDKAWRVNAMGPGILAAAAAARGARLLHVSTDFVFAGNQGTPYGTNSKPDPLGVYGRTKLEGERGVLGAAGERALILRTSWVYGAKGRNFLTTMLGLMRERDTLSVVSDQVGSPTWVGSLARVLWQLAARPDLSGIHHYADAGVASWYDFAIAIHEEASAAGIVPSDVGVVPIGTEQYPTAARRPAYSVLDTKALRAALSLQPAHWRTNLRSALEALHG